MIKEVLQLIHEGRLGFKRAIAKELNIQNETLDDILKLLVNKGYLRTNDCESIETPSCSSCPMASSCSSDNLVQTYALTARGKKYATS